jgi:type I restriction enzyme M protein
MLLLKRLSDAFDEAHTQVVQHYLSNSKSQPDTERVASDKIEYDNTFFTFFVRERVRCSNLKDFKHDIGSEFNKAKEAIAEHKASLEVVLFFIDFLTTNYR